MTESRSRPSDAPDAGDFFTGLAWDLVLLVVSVVAFAWTWSAQVADGILLVIGIVVALNALKTVVRILEHNRTTARARH